MKRAKMVRPELDNRLQNTGVRDHWRKIYVKGIDIKNRRTIKEQQKDRGKVYEHAGGNEI